MLKIIGVIFIFFVGSRVILRFKDKSISRREFIFWIFLWTGVAILIFNPNISDYAAKFLGIGRGADTIFFLSIVALFYLLFRLYVKIDRLDRDITDLTVKTSKQLRDKEKKTLC